MSTKLISGTSLQLLRRYDHRPESHRAQLLDDVIVFIFILNVKLLLLFFKLIYYRYVNCLSLITI